MREERNDSAPRYVPMVLALPPGNQWRWICRNQSEWKGDLLITGTAGELVRKWVLTVVRGNIGFLDRRFNLTKGIYTVLRGGRALNVVDLSP